MQGEIVGVEAAAVHAGHGFRSLDRGSRRGRRQNPLERARDRWRTLDSYYPQVNDTSPDDAHRTLFIRRRRWTAYFAFPFAVALLMSGSLFAVIAHENFAGRAGIAGAGFALVSALCVAIPVGRSSWMALTNKEPDLIVDSRGITEHFHLDVYLRWDELKSVSLEYGDGDFLAIVLHEGATGRGGRSIGPSLTRTVKRALTGVDLTIPLASLSYDPSKLRALLTHYMKVRRQSPLRPSPGSR